MLLMKVIHQGNSEFNVDKKLKCNVPQRKFEQKNLLKIQE